MRKKKANLIYKGPIEYNKKTASLRSGILAGTSWNEWLVYRGIGCRFQWNTQT